MSIIIRDNHLIGHVRRQQWQGASRWCSDSERCQYTPTGAAVTWTIVPWHLHARASSIAPISTFSKCAVFLGFVVHGPSSGYKIRFQKAELKKDRTRSRSEAKPHFFFYDHPTAARHETRTDRSGIPAIGGQQGDRTHRTGQADDRDARGEVTRDRNTKKSRRPVLLCTTQRPGSANNETTTTTKHPELREPRPGSSDNRIWGWGRSLIERH